MKTEAGKVVNLNIDKIIGIRADRNAGQRTYVPVKDCLLYTSPSPRDQRGSRMPSSA